MKNYTKTKLSKNLSKSEINQICKLKNTQWKHTLVSQINWFKKFVKKNDIHNFVINKKKIVGYTFLRKRTLFIKKNFIKKNYLYFDTLIINKDFRNLGLGKKVMILNSKIIRRNKLPSFLVCEKNLMKFYKKFGWKKLNKKSVEFEDYKIKKKSIMSFNLKKFENKFKIYIYQ